MRATLRWAYRAICEDALARYASPNSKATWTRASDGAERKRRKKISIGKLPGLTSSSASHRSKSGRDEMWNFPSAHIPPPWARACTHRRRWNSPLTFFPYLLRFREAVSASPQTFFFLYRRRRHTFSFRNFSTRLRRAETTNKHCRHRFVPSSLPLRHRRWREI